MRLTINFCSNTIKGNTCLKIILSYFYLTVVFMYFYNLADISMIIVLCLSSFSTINNYNKADNPFLFKY